MATSTIKSNSMHTVSVTASTATTIAAGNNAWITVPLPSSGKAVAVVGFYFSGGTACSCYNSALTSTGAQFALRNYGGSSAAVTIRADYLVV